MPTQRKHRRGLAPLADTPLKRTPVNEKADALLVAIRDANGIHGVLNVAELLARHERMNAHLIGVAERHKPLKTRVTDEERERLHEHDRHRLRARTKRRLHQTLGRAVYWSTDAAVGNLSTVLSQETRRRRPRLILLTTRATGVPRRQDARAILKTANTVGAPVLVVPPHQDLLPTRVLVATDFSPSSKRAALAGLSVLGPRGRVTLVHVAPDTKSETRGRSAQRDATAQRADRRHLQELRREIEKTARSFPPTSRRHGIVKEALLLHGEPITVILDCAAKYKSDLIVIGTRRLSKSGSMPRGSIAMAVLVGAGCAVLVAAPLTPATPS